MAAVDNSILGIGGLPVVFSIRFVFL